MSDPEERDNKVSNLFRWRQKQSFIGNDDSTDDPNFDRGSWTAFAFVIVLIAIGIALMVALTN